MTCRNSTTDDVLAGRGGRRAPLRRAGALVAALVLGGAGCVTSAPRDEYEPPGRERSEDLALISSNVLTLLEASTPYRLGVGDVLSVGVQDLEAIDRRTEIDAEVEADGRVFLPLLGMVEALGRTVPDLRRELVDRLRERFLEHPIVTVAVASYRSNRVAVIGAVKSPGIVEVPSNRITLADALSLAGGLTEGSGTQAYLFRRTLEGASVRERLDLDALARGLALANPALLPGDVIQVPEAEPYFVAGYVMTPGQYPLRRPTTVSQAVVIAGGIQIPEASPTLAYVRRRTPHGERILEADLDAIASGEALDVRLEPWDTVEVPQSTVRWVALGVYNFTTRILSFGYNLASLLE